MFSRLPGVINGRSGLPFIGIMVNCILIGTVAGFIFTLLLAALVILLTTVS